MKTKVRASVIVEVEVAGASSWCGDCSMDQIHKQAIDDFNSTISRLKRTSIQDGFTIPAYPIKIIGNPKVQMIIMNEDEVFVRDKE